MKNIIFYHINIIDGNSNKLRKLRFFHNHIHIANNMGSSYSSNYVPYNVSRPTYGLTIIPPMMAFLHDDEHQTFKKTLDNGEIVSITGIRSLFQKYRLGHIYDTIPEIGHSILITQNNELARIEDHPDFAHMTPENIAEYCNEHDGINHMRFISVNGARIYYYHDGTIKSICTASKYQFFAQLPQWHLQDEIHRDAAYRVVAHYKYDFTQRYLPKSDPRRFSEHLEMCDGKYAGYLRDTLRKNAPYCKYEGREDEDGDYYLILQKYDSELRMISSELIKNGVIIKECEIVREYPEGKPSQ